MTNTQNAQPHSTLMSKYLKWWPVLIAPAALVAWVLVAELFEQGAVKVFSEPISPPLLAVVTVIFAFRAWRTGNPLCAVLAGLAFAFTCREIHFKGTGVGIKVALGVLAFWTVAWRKRLLRAARDVAQVRWVAASAFTYALSMVVAKRVFKPKYLGMIPNEGVIHVTLEEGLELVAHLLLLLAAVMGSWKASTPAPAPDETIADPPAK